MSKLIIGFAGEIASGKGTSAAYLEKKYGAVTYRFSTILRDVVRRLRLKEDRDTIQRLSTTLRKEFGEDLLAKVMFEDARDDMHEIVVIDGVRRKADIVFLRVLREFKLVYVEAPMATRFERLTKRGENDDDNAKTWEQFQEDHKRESELEIASLKEDAAVILDNGADMDALYGQLDKIVAEYVR